MCREQSRERWTQPSQGTALPATACFEHEACRVGLVLPGLPVLICDVADRLVVQHRSLLERVLVETTITVTPSYGRVNQNLARS
jgi:hypothetical protein